jgi:hypothetical protein
MSALELIDSTRPMRVYFSYAWTTPRYDGNECWVQTFIKSLYGELKEAGLRPIMDTEDCGPGENMVRFMEGVKDSQVVLLFGTRSLVQKEKEEKYNNVQTELAMISQRLTRGVISVLLTGTARSSIPLFMSRVPVFDARMHSSYSVMVRQLITKIVNTIKLG